MKKPAAIMVTIGMSALAIICLTRIFNEKKSSEPGKASSPIQPAAAAPAPGPTGSIHLPPGFRITIYAQGMDCPRQMTFSPSGILFVGSKLNQDGKVYAVLKGNDDEKPKQVITLATGLKCPNGVAYEGGALYVAEINRILRYDNIENSVTNLARGIKLAPPAVVTDKFPSDTHHGWKYIRFGPDGKLYVPVGAPCNVCEPERKIYASLMRLNKDGSGLEQFASGIRNTVGFDFHPQTKALWFTDNGRDLLGDDIPPDELNCAPVKGMNFGFPYRYGMNVADPLFGVRTPAGLTFTPPAIPLGAHVAALGMRFYNGKMFPPQYQGNIFIAEHGSWNRSRKSGCRITRVILKGDKATAYEPFAEGWLNEQKQEYTGRPVDVVIAPDGAMLISDDQAGNIYRISYNKADK